MDKDRLNRWLTLGANLGVLVGIIFLAIELRQNNTQLELQSYQSWVASNVDINATLADPALSEIIALGHEDSRKLSKETFVAYATLNMSVMQAAQSTDYLFRAGALDRELWEAEMNRAAGILSLPGVREWWDAGGRTQLTPGFVEFLESVQSDMDAWGWDEKQGFFTDESLTRRVPQ
jgi:hypothetical protein